MTAVRKPTPAAGTTKPANHTAAIHILKAQLKMSEADYRLLLDELTTQSSCKDMTVAQLEQVRDHMTNLAVRMGVIAPKMPYVRFAHKGNSHAKSSKAKALLPLERKVWALWYALEAAGRVNKPASTQARAKALRAYVQRQTGITDMAFCTNEQLNKLVEAMKHWMNRGYTQAEMERATSI